MLIIFMNNRILVKAEYVLGAFQYKVLNRNPYTYVCNCVDVFCIYLHENVFVGIFIESCTGQTGVPIRK